jgi:uncharacterized membrane protein affecting hemolysin expression
MGGPAEPHLQSNYQKIEMIQIIMMIIIMIIIICLHIYKNIREGKQDCPSDPIT